MCIRDSITTEDKEKLGVVLSDSGFSGYLRIKDITPILENMYRQFDSSFFIKQVQRFSLPMDKQIKDFSTGMKAKLKVLVAISHGAKPVSYTHLIQKGRRCCILDEEIKELFELILEG